MQQGQEPQERQAQATWRKWLDFGQTISIIALALSLFTFYRSYVYINQQLDVTVTEVSYGTNRGELYMTVAFSNGGNRDAALLRVEPALWAKDSTGKTRWLPVVTPVSPDLPVVSPRVPMVIKAGGVEVVTLSTMMNAGDAEKSLVSMQGHAFLGIRVASMASDGNLYLVEHPVARLRIDPKGRIVGAEAAIDKSLAGFSGEHVDPPGESVTQNERTPFVWAEEHYQAQD